MQERANRGLIAAAVAGILAMGLAGWWIGGIGTRPPLTPESDIKMSPIEHTTATAPSASAPLKTYATTDKGFIPYWLVLDPIHLDGVSDHTEAVEKPMFAREYFKNQLTIIPRENERIAVAGKELVWRKLTTNSDDQLDFAQFCADNHTDSTSCLFFGFTYIVAPNDLTNVKLAIGSDDSSLWWLNGQEVVRAYASRAVNADDDKSAPVTLKKGLNVLRFAVIQGDGATGACARFFDAADKPLTSIKVSADTE